MGDAGIFYELRRLVVSIEPRKSVKGVAYFMLKQSVTGTLIRVTDNHYVTIDGNAVCHWHKDYYRLEVSHISNAVQPEDAYIMEEEQKREYVVHSSRITIGERIASFFKNMVYRGSN